MSIQFYQDSFKFPDKCFGFKLELVDGFTEIVPSTFRSFIGHYQGLFAWVKIVFLSKFLGFFLLTWDADNINPTFLSCYKKPKNFFKNFTLANNSWWWSMKCLNVLGTILANSSTNSNLKDFSGNLKGSW